MDKSLSGCRILVVEDEMMILMLIEGMLRDLGCESVVAAATVDQALALINAQTFDLAMLDVNLNGQNSYAVADALTALGLPFFFSTGYSAHGLKEGYRNQLVLNKPFQRQTLLETVASLLAAKRE
jgi:CheY-like chemotaxis protein